MMTWTIRPARIEDYDQVCAMFRALDDYHVSISPDQYCHFEGPARSLDRYTHLLSRSESFFFVVEHGAQLLGFVNGHLDTTPPFPMFKPQHFVTIVNLFVEDNHRGSGMGTALMSYVADWGRSHGVSAMRLDVIADNQLALKYYERLGFKTMRSTLQVDMDTWQHKTSTQRST